LTTSNPADPQHHSNVALGNGHEIPEPEDKDDREGNDEDEEKDEIRPSTKPRKILERKRRMNAIADSYIQEMTQKSIKEDIRLNCQIIEDQSTRYLVHQAESRKIISSPREYQTDLFERAKERNIIAVLDTGQ
jgi:endoribonuclease Dicer